MKKIVLLALSVILLVTKGFSQNEFGFYGFPQLTSIHNKANRQGDPIYVAKPTITYGGGATFSHQMNKAKSHGPIRHGALTSQLRTKKIFRFDLMYVEHHQKFTSTYTENGYDYLTHEGKKRFGYIKIPVFYQLTVPMSRKLNFSLYGGPQLSIMTKAKGGIVYWEHRKGGDYYDLPFSSPKYFKRLTADVVAGVNLEIKVSRWVHLVGGLRGDWSVTTVEKADAIVNNYPTYGTVSGFDAERGNSHNSSLALLLGINYQFHVPEHHRTRF